MKKKEWLALAVVALIAVAWIIVSKVMPKTPARPDSTVQSASEVLQTEDPYASVPKPTEEAKGEWVAVVWRNRIILYFDSGVDAHYTVTGDIGDMTIEVKDLQWHVEEVHCYDYTCQRMGWAGKDSIIPIICLPNNLVILPADEAQEYTGR